MKSLVIGATLFLSMVTTSQACDDMKTTQAIVDYVCNYSLVSNTQCRIWKEDMRQMSHNNQIIVDTFISWDTNLEEPEKFVAEN